MWDGTDKASRAKRFNEALDVRSVERSINGHNSVKSLQKQVSLKKNHLDRLSTARKLDSRNKSIESKSGRSSGSRLMMLSSQKLKNYGKNSKKESSIRTAQLMSKINEFNQIQSRIKKLESNIRAQAKGENRESPVEQPAVEMNPDVDTNS